MPTHTATRSIRDRFHRRHVRFHGPAFVWIPDGAPGLPELRPATLRPRPLPELEEEMDEEDMPQTVVGLMNTVIKAVNARGMCAAHAARLAELPAADVEGIEAMCRCEGCVKGRGQ